MITFEARTSITLLVNFSLLAAFAPGLHCLKLLYKGNEYQSLEKAKLFSFHPTAFKVKEISQTFKGVEKKLKDFSRKTEIQGNFKTVPILVLMKRLNCPF